MPVDSAVVPSTRVLFKRISLMTEVEQQLSTDVRRLQSEILKEDEDRRIEKENAAKVCHKAEATTTVVDLHFHFACF